MIKSPGTKDITSEMLVAAGHNGLAELVKLSNTIYDNGCFQEELNRSIFITLPQVTETVKSYNNQLNELCYQIGLTGHNE